jgi:NitT/TauT family transport system permease protein
MYRATLDIRSFFTGWALLIGLWIVLSYVVGVPEYLLATPGGVFRFFLENRGDLLAATATTGSEAIVGWFAALFFGLSLGMAVYYLKWLRHAALPLIIATQTTPIIALAPLITLWFGFGWLAKAAIACTVGIFPIIMATYSGLAEAKPAYVYLFRLAGVSELSILWKVRLRCAWSALIPALKVSIVLAVIGSIVGEFMGGNRGLGFFIMVATYGTKSRLLLTTVILSALLGQLFLLVLEIVTAPLEKRLGQNHR